MKYIVYIVGTFLSIIIGFILSGVYVTSNGLLNLMLFGLPIMGWIAICTAYEETNIKRKVR